MPILDSEIIWRASQLLSDGTPAQNGGRMSATAIITGVKNNLFPDVSQSERTAGSVKWRKAHIHIASAEDIALLNARVFIDALTPAGDFVTFTPGTATDTQDQISGRAYGVGTLNAAVAAGVTQIVVVGEHPVEYATLQPFRVGDLVRIADRPAVGGSGNEEWVTVSAVSYSAGLITLDFAPALAYAYASANTLVSTVLERASVAAAISNVVVTSAAGTFDSATVGKVIAHNKGAIEQDWTLTFSSATDFSVSGPTAGALTPGGSRNADYAPINPATGTAYFTIRSTAWGGTWAAAQTVAFRTSPAAIPIWYRRQVPAGAASLANNLASLAVHGESA